MPRVNVPAEGTRVCASCGKPRGNQRTGWQPITRAEVVVGYSCSDCPEASEPIRRIKSATGVRFRAVVDGTAPGATKRRQVTATLPTLDAARAWVAEVRAEVARGGSYAGAAAGETVDQLLDRWLASRVDVRQITRQGYGSSLAPVRLYMGTRAVAEVSIADVQGLIAWLGREGKRRPGAEHGTPMAVNSIKHVRVPLQQAFDQAVIEGVVMRNVVKLAKWPKVRNKRGHDLDHWQPAELLRFRDKADEHPLAGAWRLTLSGLTRSDVMGLRWSDVDLDAGVVSIAQGRVQLATAETVVDDPKSAQRLRAVPVEAIHPGTVALLRRMRAQQAADKLAAGRAYQSSGYVVVDELGYPLRPEVYSDRFRRLCVAAGVPSIRLHAVRHSLAFWFHQIGVAPADAAALLGHTVEVHLSTYLPYSGAAGIRAAARALGVAVQQQQQGAVAGES